MGICFSSPDASSRRAPARSPAPPVPPDTPARPPARAADHPLAQSAPPQLHAASAPMRPRQPSVIAATSSSQALASTSCVDCSLDDVISRCDPQRVGLMKGEAIAIQVDDPHGPGTWVPGPTNLADIVHVMSFGKNAPPDAGRGLSTAGVAFASRIFAAALQQVAPLSRHEAAVLSVAAALEASRQIDVIRTPRRMAPDKLEQQFQVRSKIGPADIAEALRGLRVGGHAFYLINNAHFAGSHMMGLSLSRTGSDTVRVSFVNPIDERVGRFVEVAPDHVEQGLAAFFSGEFFKDVCAHHVPRSIEELPTQADSSTLYTEWMKSLGPQASLSTGYFDDKPLLQTRQKGGSCTIESMFALMATLLPRDAYKLCKAACLGTVLEMAKSTLPMGTEQARIEERLASAWRGIGTRPDARKFRSLGP